MNYSLKLLDILQGFSEVKTSGESFFFKHPTIIKKLNEAKYAVQLEERAKSIGLLSKDEILANAYASGRWSKDKEDEIKSLEWIVGKTKKQIEKISDRGLIQEFESSIEKDEKTLAELLKDKASILSYSREYYIDSKAPILCCADDLFTDKTLSEKIEEYKCKDAFPFYAKVYNDLADRETLLHCAYNSAFFELAILSNFSPKNVYDKGINETTLFQKDILIYAKNLYEKLVNVADIPDFVKKDPVKLFDYNPANKKKVEENFDIKSFAESKGGLENIKPEDLLS